MKKRLNELLNGNIEYEPERPFFVPEKITGKVEVTERFRGTFSVAAPSGKAIQCFVHSTNARIGFKPESFKGFKGNFFFEADTTGLLPGDVIEGRFILDTSQGEVELPYEIAVEDNNYVSPEKAYTLDEFVELSKEHYGDAYVRFLSKDFQKNLKKWGNRYENLYRGIREQQVTYMSLEQFLLGCGKKKPVRLSLEKNHLYLKNVEETLKEAFVLQKEHWGFSRISIRSDAEFLSVEHPDITTEEFIGSIYPIHFVIDREKLHLGHNYARLYISSGYEELVAEVEIENVRTILPENSLHRQKQEIAQLLSVYLDYETDKIGKQEWLGVSFSNLENYHKVGGNHIFFHLYEAYLYMQKDDADKAMEVLGNVPGQKADWKDPALYGIYLYLTGLLNTNDNYREMLKEQIYSLFLENQENWILQLLMFRVNPESVRNDSEKLDLCRRQFESGCNSPIMYLEAYKILKKEPLLLRKLEPFEIHLLKFICREHLLDREICGQTAQIACRIQHFDKVLFSVLCRCFKVFPSINMLTAICTILINGRKRSQKYGQWYALGIKQDVRLTGLYEYFMETTEDLSDIMLPQSVRMYFIYHNTLDYVKKAQIYANIVKNKDQDPDSYDSYLPSMERFVEEQLKQGRVNQDLALLYDKVLIGELLTPAMAEGLEKILFTYELYCPYYNIKEAVILHEELEKEQRVSLNGGFGYIQLYSPDAVIVLEDYEGNRYALPEDTRIVRMLDKTELLEACKQSLEAPEFILLHECSRDGSQILITKENVRAYVQVLKVTGLKKKYQNDVRIALIGYFSANNDDENVAEFLEAEAKREIIPQTISEFMKILAYEGRYQEVYKLVSTYGMEKVDVSVLIRMCHFCITETDYEEDKMLLAVCEYCFEKKSYDESMVLYLMKYYEGSLQMMIDLWHVGKDYGYVSAELEEKILIMLLFTESHLEKTEPIFERYRKEPGKAVICRAYTVLMAYEYFVRGKKVEREVFNYLEEVMHEHSIPEVSKLALMRFYTYLQTRTPEQTKRLQNLTVHFLDKGMKFAFMQELPEKMKSRLNLQDKMILEFRTCPKTDVILHYQLNGEKEECCMMQEMVDGIYTKEFTLFYGDVLQWYYEEKTDGEKKLSQKRKLTFQKRIPKDASTRYDLINRMLEEKASHQEQKYQRTREQYLEQQYLVEELFPID